MSRLLHDIFYSDCSPTPEELLERAQESPWYLGYKLMNAIFGNEITSTIRVIYSYKGYVAHSDIEFTYCVKDKSISYKAGPLNPSYYQIYHNAINSLTNTASLEETINLYTAVINHANATQNLAFRTLV